MGNLALPLTLRKERRCIKIEKRQAVIIALTFYFKGVPQSIQKQYSMIKVGVKWWEQNGRVSCSKAAERGDIDGLQHALKQKGTSMYKIQIIEQL